METIEQSLVLLKPDTLNRGLVGEIIQRFERVGMKIVGLKLVQATKEHASSHYTEDLAIRRGEDIRNQMIDILTSGPIVAIVLEGIEAVEVVRKMIGATEPKASAPGTIRGDYAHGSFKHANASESKGMNNLIHGSATLEEAKTEVAIWFKPEELVQHEPDYTKHTLTK
ncbi:MAG TPA: nucleoside-diphosphate kinase [Patescibacteria group bacterium]|jgi:nucleoside-diphosphate kinase|nr:nucleoside-diphosphate kinase [Patescibacteria group bacterium]